MNLPAVIHRMRHLDWGAHPEVDVRLRWMLLDTWACIVAGHPAASVTGLAARMAAGVKPGQLWTSGPCLNPQGTAMWLAMAACWDEACEGHAGAHGRPGVATLAALLPLARDLRWHDFRIALLVGYEVGARMGAALRIRPGMHVDGNWPALGAAAAVACALGLDDAQVAAAVHLAACQLPLSLYRPVQTGDTGRNTYLGHSAVLGQLAAMAVASGVSAPPDGVQAYARVGLGLDSIAIDDTATLQVMDAYFKPYAAVRHVHYGAAAASLLRPELAQPLPRQVALEVYEEATVYCGNRQPQTPLQAQFSLSFGLAAMLRWGRLDPWVYRAPQFHDPLLRELEQRIVVSVHHELTAARKRGACLTLVLDDGTRLEQQVMSVAGDPDMPLSSQALRQKFITYCTSADQASMAPHWLAQVESLSDPTLMATTGF